MNRAALSILLLSALLAYPLPAAADSCSIEVTPAATLLLPYFEVNLGAPTGITTVVSVNNASDRPVLAKAEVWSDLGVPIFGFMVYLKAFDVQTINLRDVLVNGTLPQTAPPAGTFTSCAGALPPATLPVATRANYRNALTGKPVASLGGLCAGRAFNDNLARGYLTFDTMSNCTLRYQGDAGFFVSGGAGDATNQNVLWGDFLYVDQGAGLSQGSPLVHIEAKATDPETSTPGNYTFYGTFVGWTAADNREPLPTTFGVRFVNGPVGTTPTVSDLIVWRDPKVKQGPFTCPAAVGRPGWYPLNHERIEIGDETGLHYRLGARKPFSAVAQRVRVGKLPLPVRYPFGWMYLNLNETILLAGPNPPEDPAAAQAWVGTVEIGGSTLSVGYDAMHYDSACEARHSFP